MRRALAIALALALAGCGSSPQPGERPTTPTSSGYLVLRRVYDGVVETDSTVGPVLLLWDAPLRQANVYECDLTPYYYPVPGVAGTTQTTWAGAPRAAFLGTWAGARAVGDSITLPLSDFRGVPDSCFSDTAGYAVCTWDTSGAIDLARIRTVVTVSKGTATEQLVTYYTLGRIHDRERPLLIPFARSRAGAER